MAARIPAEDWIQAVRFLLAALLAVWPLAGQGRFDRLQRDLKEAAGDLGISDLRAAVSSSVLGMRSAITGSSGAGPIILPR